MKKSTSIRPLEKKIVVHLGLEFSAPVQIKNGIYHIQDCKCKDVFFFDDVNAFSNLDVINAMLVFTNSMSGPAKRNITLIIIN